MKYTKPSLSFDDQAAILVHRGLVGEEGEIKAKLRCVSYYRLAGYLAPFYADAERTRLRPNTTLEAVWDRYTFDRQLRLIALDAIERVEVAVRTRAVYAHTQKYGPFGYLERRNLPGLKVEPRGDRYISFLDDIEREMVRSREPFAAHYRAKYTSERYMPLWMASELFSFSTTLSLVRGLDTPLFKGVSGAFRLHHGLLLSWLVCLNGVRNICAHHARLWDRELVYKPLLPRPKHRAWHSPVTVTNQRVFAALTLLRYLMHHVAPQSGWAMRFRSLMDRYAEIPLYPMGFPENWRDSPIWAEGGVEIPSLLP